MSTRQLAHRLSVAQPSVSDLESSERRGTISLNSLGRAAKALDCEFVYAFIPRESFERIVSDQARVVAGRIVGRVEHTMILEDQGTGATEREEATAELASELVRTLGRELWEPWD
jgi:predicted DNA-binding mobile mystery protein A